MLVPMVPLEPGHSNSLFIFNLRNKKMTKWKTMILKP